MTDDDKRIMELQLGRKGLELAEHAELERLRAEQSIEQLGRDAELLILMEMNNALRAQRDALLAALKEAEILLQQNQPGMGSDWNYDSMLVKISAAIREAGG